MSTNSIIAVRLKDKIHAVYCNWDGYPEHHLPILTNHYKTKKQIEKLIEMGSICSLRQYIGTKAHKPEESGLDCTFFFRDIGEDWGFCAPQTFDTVEELCKWKQFIQYVYLFENNKWGLIEI